MFQLLINILGTSIQRITNLVLLFALSVVFVQVANGQSTLVLPVEVYPDLTPIEYQSLYTDSVSEYDLDISSLTDAHAYRSFNLNNTSTANKLYIEGHRLGYTDHHRSNKKDGKAYVRLNDGPWFRLDNSNVKMPENETRYGGIGGGFRTNHVTIDLDRLGGTNVLARGLNKIYFRMGPSDGVSNGFRILDIQLLDQNENNLMTNSIRQDDPNSWEAPNNDIESIEHGRYLFSKRDHLVDGDRSIRASCKDCHSQDGRDLEYFSYSNGSIVARSAFHGLTMSQGKDIASYIRSLKNSGVQRKGRPWNPPYQPGPGLDSRPVGDWAAGAGIKAVLENDSESKDFLFPDGTSIAGISKAIKQGSTDIQQINTREIPVAIQLPDWNDWLPTIHPIDIWGDYYLQELEGSSKGFYALENKIQTAMTRGRFGYKESDSVGFLLQRLTEDVYGFLSKGAEDYDYPLRVKEGTIVDRRPSHISQELANNAMSKTIAVRTFDVMQRLELEDKAKQIYGTDLAEGRQWPVRKFSLFQLAPHIHSTNRHHFTSPDINQSDLKGEYDSVAWYHAQIILNSGGKVRQGIYPVDWDYQYSFLEYLYKRSNVQTPYLHMLTLIKGMQSNTGPFGIGAEGFMVRFTRPHWMLRDVLVDMPDRQTRNNFMDAFLLNYIEIMRDKFGVMEWDAHRFSSHSDPLLNIWTNIISREAVPGEFGSDPSWFNDNADNAYNMAQFFSDGQSVSPSVLTEYLTLVKNLWPRGDFEQFSSASVAKVVIPLGTELEMGQSYSSSRYNLTFQTDGNLVLRESNKGIVWSTGSGNGIGAKAVYQGDGNLVVYGHKNNPVYASNTNTQSPLILSDLTGLMIDDNILSRTLTRRQSGAINTGSVFQAGRYKLIKTGGNTYKAYYINNHEVWSGRGLDSANSLVLNDNGLEVDGRRVFGLANYNPTSPINQPLPWPIEPMPEPSPEPPTSPVGSEHVFVKGFEFAMGQEYQVNGRKIVFQEDGNFVIYADKKPVYATHTQNRGDFLVFQGDGNLVMYDRSRKPIFASNTDNRGEQLVFKADGRLVILNNMQNIIWQSTEPLEDIESPVPVPTPAPEPQPVPTPTPTPEPAPVPPDGAHEFAKGYVFTKGQQHFVNGNFLVFQEDGNLVIYNSEGRPTYASHTSHRGDLLVLQGDGNLVIYNKERSPVYATDTNGRGEKLVFRTDGRLAILDSQSRAIWVSPDL